MSNFTLPKWYCPVCKNWYDYDTFFHWKHLSEIVTCTHCATVLQRAYLKHRPPEEKPHGTA